MLTDPEWRRLDAVLRAALDSPPQDRERVVAEACGADDALRRAAARLLRLAEDDGEGLAPSGALRGPLWDEVARDLGADPPPEQDPPPGARLGAYEVLGLLGAGGMGRVFRARHPELAREVAIKALAGAVAGDGARLRRFEREAKLLAAINHPNVATVHDFFLHDGRPYLVLELVEGETLQERLTRGALPVAEAVAVALQIAAAVAEAHARGIVHRDLKPANVKLAPGGRVKVLDFGLAKERPAPGETHDSAAVLPDATFTTHPGAVLGTAPYMSPEQTRGEPVDQRTDLWSFGCVVYEMLCGVRAFGGQNATEVLAAVLRDEVDWRRLPAGTPAGMRRLLRRCLRKDPRDRLHHIEDARLELIEADAPEPAAPPRAPRASAGLVLPWMVAAAALAAAVFAFGWRRPPPPPAAVSVRTPVGIPAGVRLAEDYAAAFALSPDASALVFAGHEDDGIARLYLRPLDQLEVQALPGTEGAWQPFFSPDGRSVAFFAGRKLRVAGLDGTPPIDLVELGGNPRGGSWGADGAIVLAPSQTSGLAVVGDRGGALRELTRIESGRGEGSHRWPHVLPGGRWALFTVQLEDETFDDADVEVVSLDTGERRPVLRGGSHARYLPSGHLVYARAGRLLLAPFDLGRLAVTGPAEVALDGVQYEARNGGAQFDVRGNVLVYSPGPPVPPEHHLVWVDERGRAARLRGEARAFREPRVSPDGRRVGMRIAAAAESELWVQDTESGTLSQITLALRPHRPIWTADGRHLTIGSLGTDGWRLLNVPASGGGPALTLYEGARRVYPNSWTPDGRFLVFQEREPDTGWDLRLVEVDADGRPHGAPQALVQTVHNETSAAVSPDGAWVAYESDELDAVVQVYVRPFRRPGDKVQASNGGGLWPRWGWNGDLYYWRTFGEQLRRVTFLPGNDRALVAKDEPGASHSVPVYPPDYSGFDVDHAGRRFLFREPPAIAGAGAARRIVLVLNWPPGSPLSTVTRR